MDNSPQQIAQYGRFELTLPGPSDGNPFVDVTLGATFQHVNRVLEAEGFYDGDGTYRVRIMPDAPGAWRYTTHSNCPELEGQSGAFTCVAAEAGVHGPVQVAERFNFAYADGTRFFPLGTTLYAWIHQPAALQAQTLEILALNSFNKVRMCVFPKHYRFNANEPDLYPFALTGDKEAGGRFDFTRPNPAFFHHLETQIDALAVLGIEADLILFHPYDRWGFAAMGQENDDRYLHYAIARLASFHNIWWSLANEYDLFKNKSTADWERFGRLVQTHDPHGHLCSVHNFVWLEDTSTHNFYDFTRPWVTHCSIQHADTKLTGQWRDLYRKPIINDECCYEGDVPDGWGNLTGEELVRRCWDTTLRGGYVTHGEVFLADDEVLWWSKGGVLKGESAPRLAFMRQMLEELPAGWLEPCDGITNTWLPSAASAPADSRHYWSYFGARRPAEVTVTMPAKGVYQAELVDTWNMTIEPVGAEFAATITLDLPRRPWLALRIIGAEAPSEPSA